MTCSGLLEMFGYCRLKPGFRSPIDETITFTPYIERRHLAPILGAFMAARNPLVEILDKTLEPAREPELLEDEGRDAELSPTFAARVPKAPVARP